MTECQCGAVVASATQWLRGQLNLWSMRVFDCSEARAQPRFSKADSKLSLLQPRLRELHRTEVTGPAGRSICAGRFCQGCKVDARGLGRGTHVIRCECGGSSPFVDSGVTGRRSIG